MHYKLIHTIWKNITQKMLKDLVEKKLTSMCNPVKRNKRKSIC